MRQRHTVLIAEDFGHVTMRQSQIKHLKMVNIGLDEMFGNKEFVAFMRLTSEDLGM